MLGRKILNYHPAIVQREATGDKKKVSKRHFNNARIKLQHHKVW